ncbi:MAG: indole-3-glycerol phosphate synthase TrpC [Chloroherpetonaceae bacterium]|nr:indole-3-glycerol phosphate synthase TrpC [Chthonomonadaceae bacterium]MDW8209170.1 indole-3-glycerol phosphate synthase TrpC [Chloroherpetonaceae bacterium]
MSMLSEILAAKRTEVAHRKEHTPHAVMQERLMEAPAARDFCAALQRSGTVALIAEIKKASPSRGVLRADFDPVEIARIYEANGAACLSVLTDEPYFQGRLEYLSLVRDAVSLPLLRKDFIIDPWQIAESRAAGADAVLLIVAALAPRDLHTLIRLTADYGMAALVEVHNAEEMEQALAAGAQLIGINNRDLHTFRTSLKVTLDLLQKFPPVSGRIVVSESGIFGADDVRRLGEAGVQAVLVGEALMREADIGAKVRELAGQSSPAVTG